jgi:hypothetical protein
MGIPMDPKMFGLLVTALCFLISLLVNLLQRRYSKVRLDRMLMKEESIVSFLMDMHKDLGKLESNCVLELIGESSPQKVGKAINGVRNKIHSTIADLEEHLRSFRQYRRQLRAQEKRRKRLDKLDQRSSGK